MGRGRAYSTGTRFIKGAGGKRSESASPETKDLDRFWELTEQERTPAPSQPPPRPSPPFLHGHPPIDYEEEKFRIDREWLGAEQHRMEEIARRDREMYGDSGAEEATEKEEAGMEASESPPSPSDPVARRAYLDKLNEELERDREWLWAEHRRLVEMVKNEPKDLPGSGDDAPKEEQGDRTEA